MYRKMDYYIVYKGMHCRWLGDGEGIAIFTRHPDSMNYGFKPHRFGNYSKLAYIKTISLEDVEEFYSTKLYCRYKGFDLKIYRIRVIDENNNELTGVHIDTFELTDNVLFQFMVGDDVGEAIGFEKIYPNDPRESFYGGWLKASEVEKVWEVKIPEDIAILK